MAINVSFNGATIFKPGAYSKLDIDLGGGFPLGPTGLIAIFGESTKGKPGSEEADLSKNVFIASQVAEVRSKYGSGAIVDAMNFLFSPASDGAIPGGAQAVYIYKTNASTRASLDIADAYGTVRSREYGIGGNTITFQANATAEIAPSVTSSAFDEALVTPGTVDIWLDGALAGQVSVAGAYTDNDALVTDVSTNWSIPGVDFSVGGDDGASTITITVSPDADAHKKGYGKSLEIAGSSPTLADLGLSASISHSSVESAMTVKAKQTRDLLEEEDTLGGNIVMLGGYEGGQTSASVQVSSSQVILMAGASSVSFDKSAYSTLSQLVDAMNLQADWSFSVSSNLYLALSPDSLDEVTVGAKTMVSGSPVRIKKDASEVAEFFELSSIVDIKDQKSVGLMDELSEVALSGGALGGTSTAAITEALEEFKALRVNSIVPLMSRDANEDKQDGLTDVSSDYTILGIHQAVKTHCNFMATTKNRSERQGYISLKASFADCLDRASLLADSRLQIAIQDIRNIDSQGVIKWFQPWAQSCMLAGARAGSPVGTPLTFKFFNATGIRHTAQAMSTAEEDILNDFNPNSQYEQAIRGGITFFEEPQSGGIRCVVDNTTYQKDSNWVYNRGNVLYAADVLSFDFRNQLENIYVGQKNTVSAAEVKSTAESIMNTFLAQGITVATPDAPNGYKSLTVRIDGNTIYINVVAVLVEGIDFILNEITVTRAQSEA
jgi:hypothetical protein